MKKALYEHDCAECLFLKTVQDKDLYIHKDKHIELSPVIVRYSSVPSDYGSLHLEMVIRVMLSNPRNCHYETAVKYMMQVGLLKLCPDLCIDFDPFTFEYLKSKRHNQITTKEEATC